MRKILLCIILCLTYDSYVMAQSDSILLDDDHKILKEAQKMLDTKFSPFHISSTLI